MVFEILTTLSFMSGAYFILTALLPVAATLAAGLWLVDLARRIVYRIALDGLELLARRAALRDDCARRELALAEAGLALRARRLELQGKRLELLDSIGELER